MSGEFSMLLLPAEVSACHRNNLVPCNGINVVARAYTIICIVVVLLTRFNRAIFCTCVHHMLSLKI
jgi:hypothetical protein